MIHPAIFISLDLTLHKPLGNTQSLHLAAITKLQKLCLNPFNSLFLEPPLTVAVATIQISQRIINWQCGRFCQVLGFLLCEGEKASMFKLYCYYSA